MRNGNIVGKSVPRKEGHDKVTGRALYVDDWTLPNMLYGATVRSTIPRGKIKNIIFGCGIDLCRADRRRSTVLGGRSRQPSRGADPAARPS